MKTRLETAVGRRGLRRGLEVLATLSLILGFVYVMAAGFCWLMEFNAELPNVVHNYNLFGWVCLGASAFCWVSAVFAATGMFLIEQAGIRQRIGLYQ